MTAGIGFVFYIFIIYIIVESPLYYLNKGDVDNFKMALINNYCEKE